MITSVTPKGQDRMAVQHGMQPTALLEFGIEITAPAKVSLAALKAVLKELGHAPASEADLAPVLAA